MTQAEELVRLAGDMELFHAPDDIAYASLDFEGHRETWRVRGRETRSFLRQRFFQLIEEKPPSSQAISDAIAQLEARAQFQGQRRAVYTRVAILDDVTYVDLVDENWRVVEIDSDGWRLLDRSPVHFRRARGMLPLPAPEPGGTITDLRPFLNIEADDDFVLVVSFTAYALGGAGPYTILAVSGEQGTAKSTQSRIIRSLVDPNVAPLRRPPRDERDLMIAARNGHIVAFDNLSYLPAWLSDCICTLATGGGLSTRQLYSDDDEVLFDATRPCLLNGIEELATRGDILDRSIIIMLPVIPDARRQPESELWARFEAARPRIFGALLDAVSTARQRISEVKIEALPRMADFAIWCSAAAPSLGWDQDTFLTAYEGNRQSANALALDASSVASVVVTLIEERPVGWGGTAAALLEELGKLLTEDQRRQKTWPKTPRALSGQLRRLGSNLRRAGIEVGFRRQSHTGQRLISIDNAGILPSPPSEERENGRNSQQIEQLSPDGTDMATVTTVTVPSPPKSMQTNGPDGGDGRDGEIPT